MIKDSERFAEEDKVKDLVDAKNELESYAEWSDQKVENQNVFLENQK